MPRSREWKFDATIDQLQNASFGSQMSVETNRHGGPVQKCPGSEIARVTKYWRGNEGGTGVIAASPHSGISAKQFLRTDAPSRRARYHHVPENPRRYPVIFGHIHTCSRMADDLLGDVLELEDGFYNEGFEAGVADSAYAGMLEGKVFGIEKGYDKALELGKLNGRALVWQRRQQSTAQDAAEKPSHTTSGGTSASQSTLDDALQAMNGLGTTSRLVKQIETLMTLSDTKNVPNDNSDASVSQVEDAIAKSKAKAKIVAVAAGEPLEAGAGPVAGIEDSIGLSARH